MRKKKAPDNLGMDLEKIPEIKAAKVAALENKKEKVAAKKKKQPAGKKPAAKKK